MSVDKGVYKILIIEDNPGDSALVTDFLQEKIEMPYISYAKSFKEAKNKLSVINDQYDIILLDISLPDKTGAPLIKEIVEMCFATPIIVLTGYEDFTFGLKSLSMGIADYILKDDLSASALYKSIVYTLERKKSTIALEESEKKYSELFHMSPLPMYVSELETSNFLDVNDAFIKHYGYTRDEVLQMNLKDIRPKKEITNPEEGILNDVSKAQKGSLGICNHLKKNGEIIQVDIKNNFIEYKGKDAKVTVATDVTERLRYIKE
ncbi:MAG: response regulator, partial [Mucilaginibacter sp.]